MKNIFFRLHSIALLVCTSLMLTNDTSADVRLPAVFGDHMVLQQQMTIRIWGWADAGESVAVTLGSNTVTAKPDDTGRWQVELPEMTASKQPVKLTVKGKNTLEFHDVLIGEVWLCSGQSNMEWTVGSCTNAAAEIAAAKSPMIRHIKVPLVQSTVPLDDFKSSWQVCSPETAGGFTACGYFMARELQKQLDVPVGLVNSSWGGTRVEPWTPPVGFQNVPALQDTYRSVIGRTPGTPEYRERLNAHINVTAEWLTKAKAVVNTNQTLAPSPAYPAELTPFTSNQDPTMLYNGMIHSLVGFPIRGAIWYQGESNHTEGMLYLEKKKALIGGWRQLWKQGEFPFYYVQIAPYQYGSEDPAILPKFWEAQAAVQQIPHTGMVVINDIATLNDIHPPNKQDVGYRLALLALKNDYGKKEIVANSPEFDSLEVVGDQLKVTFRNTGGGLKTRDGEAPTRFEIIGVGSNGFQPTTAKIEGDVVILSAEGVSTPAAFRFAWHMLAEPNLTGRTGLPAGACRGGEIPGFLNQLPAAKEYTLVYDLDLSKVQHDIKYDVDNSDQIKSFDRIAYLLETSVSNGDEQNLFVSMKAFTDDVRKIGIPTIASNASFQQTVSSMDVFSNVKGITTGTNIETGNIEFWPDNYAMTNSGGVKGASDAVYDFGDAKAPPMDGYGSMQIHNFSAGETLVAINHWTMGNGADIGIGNSTGQSLDWTFTANAGSYSMKRLRVFVRSK
ncbi:MAG: 9-O-acetylesterase [Planctomycetota bacterium]|nr:9-O-acetylesterase [Planctomycetota bacterium]